MFLLIFSLCCCLYDFTRILIHEIVEGFFFKYAISCLVILQCMYKVAPLHSLADTIARGFGLNSRSKSLTPKVSKTSNRKLFCLSLGKKMTTVMSSLRQKPYRNNQSKMIYVISKNFYYRRPWVLYKLTES